MENTKYLAYQFLLPFILSYIRRSTRCNNFHLNFGYNKAVYYLMLEVQIFELLQLYSNLMELKKYLDY